MDRKVFSLLLLASCATAVDYLVNGKCPSFGECRGNVSSVQHVAGIWWLYADIPMEFQVGFKCTYLNFTVSSLQPSDYAFHFDRIEIEEATDKLRQTDGIHIFSANGSIHEIYTDRKFFGELCCSFVNRTFNCSEAAIQFHDDHVDGRLLGDCRLH